MSRQASYWIEAGPLYWGSIRKMVQILQCEGFQITMTESKGWLSRVFTMRGDRDAIQLIDSRLDGWMGDD